MLDGVQIGLLLQEGLPLCISFRSLLLLFFFSFRRAAEHPENVKAPNALNQIKQDDDSIRDRQEYNVG